MFRRKKSGSLKPYSLADLHAKQSGRKRVRVWSFFLIGVLVLTGGTYLIFLSSFLRVQTFTFSDPLLFSREALLEKLQVSVTPDTFLSSVLGDDNILLWNERSVNDLSVEFSSIASVEVHRDFLKRAVTFTIRERERKLIWCHISRVEDGAETPRCFWIDGVGLIFEEAPIPRGGLVRVVYDYSSRALGLGDYVLDEDTVPNLFFIFDLFERFDFVVTNLVLDNLGLREVTGNVTAGPFLYFSLDTNPSFALPVIDSLIASGEWRKISYLDMRVENKAYYSYR